MFICPEELFLYRKIIKSLNRGLFGCHRRIEPFKPRSLPFDLDEDLQMFPVDPSYLSNLKQRVRLASDISRLHHQAAKVANENNWYHKAAKELDIELDDNIRCVEK